MVSVCADDLRDFNIALSDLTQEVIDEVEENINLLQEETRR